MICRLQEWNITNVDFNHNGFSMIYNTFKENNTLYMKSWARYWV